MLSITSNLGMSVAMIKHVFLVLIMVSFGQLRAVERNGTLDLDFDVPVESWETDMLFLLVDKTALRADLMTWPSELGKSEVLISFRIAIGKEEGDKQVEGDNRTPEGIYFAQNLIDGRTLPARYGPFAIPINFPNPFDRAAGKTGHGIWLHGVEEDSRVEEANVTEGCVAFFNSDIKALSRWIKPFQSVIVITHEASEANQKDDIKAVYEQTQKWHASWASRELDTYISYYHDDRFRFRGMDLDGFTQYKKRVFGQYENMEVVVNDIRVFSHREYAISVFNQDFNGDDRYVTRGRKVLYWERDDQGDWKITHEVFESRRFEFPSYSRDLLVKLFQDSPSAKQFSKESVTTSSF